MSIAALHDLSAEVRRLAIAGAALAPGDFRLRKLIEPLAKSGEKAPVFAKVAAAVQRVIDADENTASPALLDLSTLTNAILYTQGKTGAEGELEPLATHPVQGTTTSTSYRLLAPLIEALTQPGQGRYDVVAEALRRGTFRDVRLIRPAIQALGDRYGELATLVTDEVLPAFGPGIGDVLAADLDPKGGVLHARRLRALAKVDPERGRAAARAVLDDATKDVRIAALEALKGSADDIEPILAEAKSKLKDVRRAAFGALAGIRHSSVEALQQAAVSSGDLEILADTIDGQLSDELIATLIAEAEANLGPEALDRNAQQVALMRVAHVLQALSGRVAERVEAFLLDVVSRRKTIIALKATSISGTDILQQATLLLATSASDPARRVLAEQHPTLPRNLFDRAFLAAALVESPKTLLDTFANWLKDPSVRSAIEDTIIGSAFRSEVWAKLPTIEWHNGWLAAAVKADRHRLVCHLLTASDSSAEAYLEKKLTSFFETPERAASEAGACLERLIQFGNKQSTKLLLKTLEVGFSLSRYHYGTLGNLPLIAALPMSEIKAVEAFIKKLPKDRANQVQPFLDELRAKATSSRT